MAYTVAITNVECGQNIAVDRANLDVVSFTRRDDTDKFQQWIQFGKEDGLCFKNVGSGAYLCADENPLNPDGVKANLITQSKWLLLPVKNQNNVTRWRIRPFSTGSCVNSKNIKMEGELSPVKLRDWTKNENTILWDITPIS